MTCPFLQTFNKRFMKTKKEGYFEFGDGAGLPCRSFRCDVLRRLSGNSETHSKMYLP